MINEPTLKDIAREAGVSVAAVSKVLNNRIGVGADTRERITEIAQRMRYRGRGGRATSPSHGLSNATIVTLDRYVLNDAFYGPILNGLMAAGAEADIDIKIAVTADVASTPLSSVLKGHSTEALLLLGIDQPELIDEAVKLGCPTVIVNGMDRTMRLSSVSADYHFGAWAATRHLLELGHRDILHVTHPYRESIKRRLDGFRNALDEAGIRYDPDRHMLDLGAPEKMTTGAGSIIADHIEARGSVPDALFCVSDIVALGAIQELTARGLSVPGDISVMGFDGLSIGAHASPSLTSMQIDRDAMGRIAMQLLTEYAANPAMTVQRVTVGVALQERQSTSLRKVSS
ncbi:LacI family DNA-binding transcriptional regulator [Granulosicoccus antarcticus]|uniref:Catabolite control protein A n=1 Tax=Granulosicoccus antarcticus IMCC3135 TaxID=1192854 RepID=A0A2Z2P0R6_9GAMM|nr:LacI family DNA-binding transcriptional regulator [Granulosicoccus antarcticus]ASJ73837.1 Catabolite control protein A [Granulosicoccus antarcticus IMCC3135]